MAPCRKSILTFLLLATLLSLSSVSAQVPTTDNGVAPPEPIPFDEDATSVDCELARKITGRFKSISEIHVALNPINKLIPNDCSDVVFLGQKLSGKMDPNVIDFHWEATNFFHQPLYFDDTPLERYGQSLCRPAQPGLSGARFFLTFPAIPYKMGVDRTHDCISTLGLYRPGSCAPCTREVILRGDPHAALFQAATTVGLIFLLP